MVGAMDVPICIFCRDLVAPVDALFNAWGDAYCRSCGRERGLIETIGTNAGTQAAIASFMSIDALTFTEGVSGKSGRQIGHLVGAKCSRRQSVPISEARRRTQTLEKFARELQYERERTQRREQRRIERRAERLARTREREAAIANQRQRERAQRRAARIARDIRSLIERRMLRALAREQRCIDRAERIRCRVERRAALWLRRDRTIRSRAVSREARRISELQIDEARAALDVVRKRVYRQQHPRTWADSRKFTNREIVHLRTQYAAGGTSLKRLAATYGVSAPAISQIVTGATYKSVGGPVRVPMTHVELESLGGIRL